MTYSFISTVSLPYYREFSSLKTNTCDAIARVITKNTDCTDNPIIYKRGFEFVSKHSAAKLYGFVFAYFLNLSRSDCLSAYATASTHDCPTYLVRLLSFIEVATYEFRNPTHLDVENI